MLAGGVGSRVMVEICQRMLGGLRMLAEWAPSIEVPILGWMGEITNHS